MIMEAPEKSALERACQAVHGSSRLAALLTANGRKVSKASISRWKKERVPAEACPDIEAITGIPCEELRPDVSWAVLRDAKAAPVGQFAQSPEAKARFAPDVDEDLSQSIDPSGKG
jgi:DNA-binding transcriptional regulator YdaS (Cro superfamily)